MLKEKEEQYQKSLLDSLKRSTQDSIDIQKNKIKTMQHRPLSDRALKILQNKSRRDSILRYRDSIRKVKQLKNKN